MRDEHKPGASAAALLIALLMAAAASAAGGDPGLVAAARSQDALQVRALLKQRVNARDVNVRADDGSTALLWAAHWNDRAVAALLIRAGADANAANDFRATPLSEA
jgi:ankyrin repeat protein